MSIRSPRRAALSRAARTSAAALVALALVWGVAPVARAQDPDPSPTPSTSPSPQPTVEPTPAPTPAVVLPPDQQIAAMTASPLQVVGPDGFVATADEYTIGTWLAIGPVDPTPTPSPTPTPLPTDPPATPDPLATPAPEPTPTPTPDPFASPDPGVGGQVATKVVIDRAGILSWLGEYASRYAVPGRNASFKMNSKGVFTSVIPSKDGRGLDRSATARSITEALNRRAVLDLTSDAATLVVGPARPALTTEKAKAMMPKMRKISGWTTYWQVGENNGFGANIIIPAKKIHGTLVMPGEVFDFWKVVGIPTTAQGYRAGGAIINGKSEPTGAFAGGICSTSTTIFNAAVRAGFKILSRVPHYYYIDRYPLGLDATVWIDGGSKQSVKWQNDTENPVFIRAVAKPGIVTFELYSLATGRKVSFSKPKVTGRVGAADLVEYTSSLAPGAAQRLEFPHVGMYVEVTRTVRDRDGAVIHREVWKSNYRKVDGRTLVGRANAAPTPPPPTQPGPRPIGGPRPQ